MADLKCEVAVQGTCEIGEGPVWDRKTNSIWWINIPTGMFIQYHPSSGDLKTYEAETMVGSFAFRESGGIIAALKNGFAFFDPKTGQTEFLVKPEIPPHYRFNDGKCDLSGRFWAGTMDMVGSTSDGTLYMFDAEHNLSAQINGVSCSNGLAWSSDQRTLYFIDTSTRKVEAFDYDAESGKLSNRRTILIVTDGYPDGMTIDSEGKLWIALWDGWKVIRVDPDKGEIIFHVDVPAAKVTSCAFGGENLDDLYITTACSGLTKAELEKQPLAGSLFVVKNSGFRGLLPELYKG